MPAPWARLDRSPTYRLVLDRVEEQLASRALSGGDALPSERLLSELLEASRPAVREAIRVLQTHGIVGQTAFAAPEPVMRIQPSPADGFITTLRLHLAAASLCRSELADTRVTLEQASIRALAQAGNPGIVAHLQSLIQKLDTSGLSVAHRRQIDADFHRTIAGHDGNRMTQHLVEAITEIEHSQHTPPACSPRCCCRSPVREYQQIVDAIRAQEPDLAASCLEGHTRGAWR